MSTDLKTVKDHPARILDRDGYTFAAAHLMRHENVRGLTFVALDNDALEAVREAYEDKRQHPSTVLGADLADAIRDLLGLDD